MANNDNWCQILVKRGEGNTNSPELSLLKILPLACHFLAATLNFTYFSTMVFLGAAPFFTVGLFWIT